jgi:hypothetical protein
MCRLAAVQQLKGKQSMKKKEREGTPAVKVELGRPLKLVVL